jgi:hypothetical protein
LLFFPSKFNIIFDDQKEKLMVDLVYDQPYNIVNIVLSIVLVFLLFSSIFVATAYTSD